MKEIMKIEHGWLGRRFRMENGATMTRVFHTSYKKERVSEKDIEELFFLTQRSGRCIFQENCLNVAIHLCWSGFSCIYCPLKNQAVYSASLENMRGRIPLEIY